MLNTLWVTQDTSEWLGLDRSHFLKLRKFPSEEDRAYEQQQHLDRKQDKWMET
jgi:hypothetical protein